MDDIEFQSIDQQPGTGSHSQYPELYQTPSFAWSGQIDDVNQASSPSSSAPGLQYSVDPDAQIHYLHQHGPIDEGPLHSPHHFSRHNAWQSAREVSSHLADTHAVQNSVADDRYADESME